MTLKPLVSLLMTLVIVTQLVRTHCSSTVSPQSDVHCQCQCHDSAMTVPKKTESSYLYLFGGYTPLSKSNSTSRLSIATGEWKSMKDMPTGRAYFCGAVVAKKIYLFGGYNTGVSGNRWNRNEIAPNAVYNCLTDTYTPLPPMPDFQRVHCAAAALGQSIYVSGGEIPITDRSSRSVNSLLRFDTRSYQWTTLAPMNTWRGGHKLIELGGLLYAIGGDFDNNRTEVYNATTNKWSQLAETDYDIDETGSATSHEGKIYAFGLGGFEVYSPDTNQWTNLTQPTDKEVNCRKLVSMNGKLWSVGSGAAYGSKIKSEFIENLHSFDPSTHQWKKEQKIDVERDGGFSAFVVDF